MCPNHNLKNEGIQVREALPGEMDEVSLLLRDAYRQYEAILPAGAWEYYLQDIMDVRSRLDMTELIVAVLNGRLVGAVTLFLKPSLSPQSRWPADWAGVRLLAVHPDFRNRGIGRALMDECIRRCREQGIRTIGLNTTAFMEAALRMYEGMGFKRVPEYDRHPSSGVVVLAYRLDI